MGMYTELLIKADIRTNISEIEKNALEYLFNEKRRPDVLPDHSFFGQTRADYWGRGCSYYHIPWAVSKYQEDYIFCRMDIKGYGSEIEDFLDWFYPLVDNSCYECYGWTWYEEATEPTLLYKRHEE